MPAKKKSAEQKNEKLSKKTFEILKNAFEFMLIEDEDCAQIENGRGFNREDSFCIHEDFTGEVTEEFIINHGHRPWTYRKTQLTDFKLKDLEAAINEVNKINGKNDEGKVKEETIEIKENDRWCQKADGFLINSEGIYYDVEYIEKLKSYKGKSLCSTPCILSAIGKNLDSGELLFKIKFLDAEGTEKEAWKDSTELLQRSGALKLQKDGLLFAESEVSKINGFFKALISQYTKELNKEIVASKNGWKKEKTIFVVGSIAITTESIKPVLQRDNPTADIYSQNGTLSEQVWAINQIIDYKAVTFKLYTACIPPLLTFLDLPSFVQEQRVRSGSFKTGMGYMAASIWGNPIQLQINPKSTQAGIEKTLQYSTDLPIFIDETSITDTIKDLVYMVANGIGRSKSNSEQGLVIAPTWSVVVLTTGEKPILPETALEGQQVRIVPLKDGVRDKLSSTLVKKIKNVLINNYGHIGVLFIQEIFKEKENLKDIYNKFFNSFTEVEDITSDRAKEYYAGIATAGYLLEKVFTQIEVKNHDPLDICKHYFNENVIDNVFMPDYVKALKSAFSWFSANETYFQDEDLNHERYGWIRDDCICFIPEKLQKHLNTEIAPNTYEGASEEWKNLEILIPKNQKDNKTGKIYKLKINQISTSSGKKPIIKIPIAKFREYLGLEDDTKTQDKKDPKTEDYKEPDDIPEGIIHRTANEINVAEIMGAEGL